MNTDRYRVKPGAKLKLTAWPTDDDGGLTKEEGLARSAKLLQRLAQLQELLYATRARALLVVLQAMDGGGKDSTIRHVFDTVNPQGCRFANFKVPTDLEKHHDFLWRVHQEVPPLGYLGVFNRSHYEDVLVVRVKQLAPERIWKTRYAHINDFEQLLTDEGTAVVKFYLHISKAYQKERLERRLAQPDKHWKFDPNDLAERKRWGQYQRAYEAALSRCSTDAAPWYVVPGENRWFRDLLVAQVLVDTLESFKLTWPKPAFDPKKIVVE